MKRIKANPYIYINYKLRQLELSLSYREYEEEGERLAECSEMQIIAPGKTKRKAYDTLVEMVVTTLIVAIETNSLKDHLKALDFRMVNVPVPSVEIYESKKRVASDTIPLIINSPIPVTSIKDETGIELLK
ncbi:MAG TPA: hypothetical protein VGB30_07990 [bacterium]|jgi:hypothetical protein